MAKRPTCRSRPPVNPRLHGRPAPAPPSTVSRSTARRPSPTARSTRSSSGPARRRRQPRDVSVNVLRQGFQYKSGSQRQASLPVLRHHHLHWITRPTSSARPPSRASAGTSSSARSRQTDLSELPQPAGRGLLTRCRLQLASWWGITGQGRLQTDPVTTMHRYGSGPPSRLRRTCHRTITDSGKIRAVLPFPDQSQSLPTAIREFKPHLSKARSVG